MRANGESLTLSAKHSHHSHQPPCCTLAACLHPRGPNPLVGAPCILALWQGTRLIAASSQEVSPDADADHPASHLSQAHRRTASRGPRAAPPLPRADPPRRLV